MSGPSDEGKEAGSHAEGTDEWPKTRLSDIERRRRDQKLWELLPSSDDPYDSTRLSEGELAAFEEALGDGFGGRFNHGSEAADLPQEVESGLLRHSFYADPTSDYDPKPDEDGDRWDHDFWARGDEDEPAPYRLFPLGFQLIRLRIYFRNQFERYCQHLVRENQMFSELDPVEFEDIFADFGWDQLYLKPWYELHALRYIDWIYHPHSRGFFILTNFSGTLGRLVEQYYWRFRYEGLVKTGIGARTGASAGGKTLALINRKKRASWQRVAEEIWARKPGLNKNAVAKAVRNELRLNSTIKNIARFIRRPGKK